VRKRHFTQEAGLSNCAPMGMGVHFGSAGNSKRKFWMTMLPMERIAYSAIKDRPRLALPGGARLGCMGHCEY